MNWSMVLPFTIVIDSGIDKRVLLLLCQIKFRVLSVVIWWIDFLIGVLFCITICGWTRERMLFRRDTLVGVTTIGDRGSWSYLINLGPLKCTRPPSPREGVWLSILIALFCGCQWCSVQLIVIVSISAMSIVTVWYKRGFGQQFYI